MRIYSILPAVVPAAAVFVAWWWCRPRNQGPASEDSASIVDQSSSQVQDSAGEEDGAGEDLSETCSLPASSNEDRNLIVEQRCSQVEDGAGEEDGPGEEDSPGAGQIEMHSLSALSSGDTPSIVNESCSQVEDGPGEEDGPVAGQIEMHSLSALSSGDTPSIVNESCSQVEDGAREEDGPGAGQIEMHSLSAPSSGDTPGIVDQSSLDMWQDAQEDVFVSLDDLDCLEQQPDLDLKTGPPPPEMRGDRCMDFECMGLLGRGGFGKVVLAEYKKNGAMVAIKALKKSDIVARGLIDSVLCEKRILEALINEPFVVDYYGSFQTAHHVAFILEWAPGGDLRPGIYTDMYSEPRAVFYAACVVLGLEALHKRNIVHRDLKLENLLMDADGYVKLGDFGLCREGMGVNDRASTICGMPQFMAPEMLTQPSYTRDVDWWSFGVLLYEMLVGKIPFNGRDHKELTHSIVHDIVHYPRFLSAEAVSILSGLLQKDPKRRLGAGWRGAQEVKRHPFFEDVDWAGMQARTVEPPFLPPAKRFQALDHSAKPILTPPPLEERALTPEEQDIFSSFQYVADWW
ncbi:serine/threonine-protein kinase N2-like [Amia ocellicauda]|uniref:serine/threonine-protein kinase N2-like n=2 Tax=Amia ocellicauda TaxID=2972642 RepID=UPI00346402FD